MSSQKVIGSRIRERRMDQGLRQADVAETVGISASYLNLIEHNKRRIGGKLLGQLAQVLAIDVTSLTQGGDTATLDGMRAAAARLPDMPEVDRAEDLAARYPAWARLIAAQDIRIDTLEAELQSISDRMAHDPALASALHNVISAVTSIRATAGILVSGDRVDADWQSRFHENIHDDSQKLAMESKALVSYLDQPKGAKAPEPGASVFDQVDALLAEKPDLGTGTEAARPDQIPTLMGGFDLSALSPYAQTVLSNRLARMAVDAQALPFRAFRDKAQAVGGDPAQLAAHFQVPLSQVMRRLTTLPADTGLPPMGLAICDAAGALTTLKTVPGFGLHRRAVSCPLWPLYAALLQPATALRMVVGLPDASETRFLCYASAQVIPPDQFGAPPQVESTMLVVADPDPGTDQVVPVGTTCRVCPRTGCNARREPSVTSLQR